MFDSKSPVAAFETSGYAAVVDHTHDFVEIVYVLDGKGKQIIGDKEIDLEKGDMFIISSNESHSIVPEFNALQTNFHQLRLQQQQVHHQG